MRPDGPWAVGSVTQRLVDPARPTHLAAGEHQLGRALRVKAWYPAEPEPGIAAERIWTEIRNNPSTPAPVRLLLKLWRTRTASRPGARFAADLRSAPDKASLQASLIVYNHGLVSFPSENTNLMEALASHGRIVLSIAHEAQAAEFEQLKRAQPAEERRSSDALNAEIPGASATRRAELGEALHRLPGNAGRIAVERAADTSFVLDRVATILDGIPDLPAAAVAGDARADLLGFSLGGAVATVAAERDRRVTRVVNIDGGMYGANDPAALRLPYLMLHSASSNGLNDRLLPAGAQRWLQPDSAHLNHHDIALLLPVLRHLRVLGSTCPRQFLAARNRAIVEFLGARERRPLSS